MVEAQLSQERRHEQHSPLTNVKEFQPLLDRVEKKENKTIIYKKHITEQRVQNIIEVREVPITKVIRHDSKTIVIQEPVKYETIDMEGKEYTDEERDRIFRDLGVIDMKGFERDDGVTVLQAEPEIRHEYREVKKRVIKPIITVIHEQPIIEEVEQVQLVEQNQQPVALEEVKVVETDVIETKITTRHQHEEEFIQQPVIQQMERMSVGSDYSNQSEYLEVSNFYESRRGESTVQIEEVKQIQSPSVLSQESISPVPVPQEQHRSLDITQQQVQATSLTNVQSVTTETVQPVVHEQVQVVTQETKKKKKRFGKLRRKK